MKGYCLHEEGGIHDHFVVGHFVLLLALLQNVPDEVTVFGLGVHPANGLFGRVAEMFVATLTNDGRHTPEQESLSERSWCRKSSGSLLKSSSLDGLVDQHNPVCRFTSFA